MKLHNFFRSGTSHRLRIALKLKGLDYDYVSVYLRKEAHLAPAFKARPRPSKTSSGGWGRSQVWPERLRTERRPRPKKEKSGFPAKRENRLAVES